MLRAVNNATPTYPVRAAGLVSMAGARPPTCSRRWRTLIARTTIGHSHDSTSYLPTLANTYSSRAGNACAQRRPRPHHATPAFLLPTENLYRASGLHPWCPDDQPQPQPYVQPSSRSQTSSRPAKTAKPYRATSPGTARFFRVSNKAAVSPGSTSN